MDARALITQLVIKSILAPWIWL